MEPYIGVIFYILFFFWEIYLITRYLKLIRTKKYEPRWNNQEEILLQMDYLPEEIAHMFSIEEGNYFSESMSKVNTTILLDLFQEKYLKAEIGEKNQIKRIKSEKKQGMDKIQKEVWNLVSDSEKRLRPGYHLKMRDLKWKVFGYQRLRQSSQKINQILNNRLKEKRLLCKTSFETIDRIAREIFLNFILLFVVYGITYLSFIPTMEGMILAILFTLCNMILGFIAKKRISRYNKKGMDELEKIRMFGEALLETVKEEKEPVKLQIVEEYYPYAYACGIENEMLRQISDKVDKEKYPFVYLLKETNFLKELKEVERTNAFKLKKIY